MRRDERGQIVEIEEIEVLQEEEEVVGIVHLDLDHQSI